MAHACSPQAHSLPKADAQERETGTSGRHLLVRSECIQEQGDTGTRWRGKGRLLGSFWCLLSSGWEAVQG